MTRVMTDEEKAQLEVPFVGKNGTTRKLEVRRQNCLCCIVFRAYTDFSSAYSRKTETKKIIAIRDQVAGAGS